MDFGPFDDDHWGVRIELTDGRRIEIRGFDGGNAKNRPAPPELRGAVDEVIALLGVRPLYG